MNHSSLEQHLSSSESISAEHDNTTIITSETMQEFQLQGSKKTIESIKENKEANDEHKTNLNAAELGSKIGIDKIAISQLAKIKRIGTKVGRAISFFEEEQQAIDEFFKENISTKQFFDDTHFDKPITRFIIQSKSLGTQLGKGTYLSKEDRKVIETFFNDNANTKKVANELKKDEKAIQALASLKNLGTQLGQGTYLSKEEIRIIEAFFEENKSANDYAGEIQKNPPDVKALASLKNLGTQLGQGTYLSKEDQQAIKTFFDDNIVSLKFARSEGYDKNAVFDLSVKKNIGVQLYKTIYLSEHDQQVINDFFKENKNAEEVALEFDVPASVLRTLANLKQLGVRLGQGIYLSKEDMDVARDFFNNTMNSQNLGKDIGFNPSAIAALARQKGIGLQLGAGSDVTFRFSKEEQQEIYNISKNLLSISDVANKLGSSKSHINAVIEMLGCEKKQLGTGFYIDKKDLSKITELSNEIKRNSGGSIPENIVAFYIQQVIPNTKRHYKPSWLKGLKGGQMEIDIFVKSDNPPPPGIGIEYDGYYHDEEKKESDIHKNMLAREHGIPIIRIREKSCPKLPDDIPCIIVQETDYYKKLVEPIEQLFAMLGISLPESGIDIKRDKQQIFEFVSAKLNQENDKIPEEKIEDGILAYAT